MFITPESIHDKIEFFQEADFNALESAIQQKIDANSTLMLEVHHVSYETVQLQDRRPYVTAMVHFKQKKRKT
ncbi:DUF2536 family protein [Alkalicoccus luteus]|uniref:YrzA family protein n=1 Tax=Alkalicoccus luteus TaxID=1237094 RepID=A0A969PRC5_9BACI|nr:DUF2536 family protein [Alkalicoccus luteus]NJP36543.1 YrzA family protein [Alkalicoccus luteus]